MVITTKSPGFDDIRSPFSADAFEDMCVHIYSNLYHSIGAWRYGRNGQRQGGKDIILHDFCHGPQERRQGMVVIQCKNVSSSDLKFESIKDDILDAAKSALPGRIYEGTYLFVVATTARNNAQLHDAIKKFTENEDLPFNVELHAWDKLCSLIYSDARLRDLYTTPIGGAVPHEFSLQVERTTKTLAQAIQQGRLADAYAEDCRRKNPNYVPAYGTRVSQPPPDIWKRSPPLRRVLIDLYSQAGDAQQLVELRLYEFNLGGMRDAGSCLAYLLSERISQNLRSPHRPLLFKGDAPGYAGLLESMSDVIMSAQGSPDQLACLAMLLIMETDIETLHNGALQMMRELIDRSKNTPWHWAARVAYSAVRYYHVLRRGWTDATRRFAVGDKIGYAQRLGPHDPRLDQPFDGEQAKSIKLLSFNPQDPRSSGGFGAYFLVKSLISCCTNETHEFHFPLLQKQCRIYCADNYRTNESIFSPNHNASFHTRRVASMETLGQLIANKQIRKTMERFALGTTEYAFERLLGYRAVVRAESKLFECTQSDKAELVEELDWLIAHCRIGHPNQLSERQLTILSVYDNPPSRILQAPQTSALRPAGFTLSPHALAHRAAFISGWPSHDERSESLEQQYRERENDFNLSCLLALHISTPLLLIRYGSMVHASSMGIGAEGPGDNDNGLNT
ncbi:hypothetical protein GTP81_18000 [Rugamonas sp. FT107W]|uniref:Restriction endonuclease type IV Mrr domain-containing protein n=1 Tax=Duganella vulcania TaxID=2692166 RepID=A0A845HMA6_9BURK|nr:hypothetical protein [Duganella vulcania]MYN18645.1 hypothetical protein [Duganella vulcania]